MNVFIPGVSVNIFVPNFSVQGIKFDIQLPWFVYLCLHTHTYGIEILDREFQLESFGSALVVV